MTAPDLLAIGDSVVGRANPGEQIEVIVVDEQETEVRVFDGGVESFTAATSQGIGIRVIRDNRQGFAWAGSLEGSLIDVTLADARDNAEFGTEDPALAVAEPDGVALTELNLYDEALAGFSTESKIDLALELDAITKASDPRVTLVESVDFVDSISNAAVVNSSGIRISGRDGGCYAVTTVVASDDDDSQIGFGYTLGRSPLELKLEEASTMAVERATRLLGAVKPETGHFRVILDPMVTAQFVGIIGSTLSGEAVLKGRSLFGDRLGEDVGSSTLTLVDDPTNPLAFTASEADGEGLATRRNVLIEDGQLKMFMHNSYTGRCSNGRSTGNAIRGFASTPGVGPIALALDPGARQQSEMLADLEDGILVHSLSGLHSGVNPVSGDFSAGATGLRIRSGELAEPLREFTIASTLQRMLLDVSEVGADLEWLPGSAAGLSLCVDGIMVSGS